MGGRLHCILKELEEKDSLKNDWGEGSRVWEGRGEGWERCLKEDGREEWEGRYGRVG